MNKVKALIASAVVVTGMVGATAAVKAQANNANKCAVEPAALNAWGNGLSVNGQSVSASFTVKGSNCVTPVTLAVWERPTAEGIRDQKLFDFATVTVGPGRHTNAITVDLPECMWQADIVEGADPKGPDGTADYMKLVNGEWVGNLRDFKKGGSGVCTTPTEEPCPYDETMDKDDPNCKAVEEPEKEVVVKEVKTVETKEVPVESVPNTGPASILATTFGVSTSAGLGYNLFRNRRNLLK